MKAMKPVTIARIHIKYGFVKVKQEYYICPICRNVLNAGPNYQPEHCDKCGQNIDFSEIKWKEEKILGYTESLLIKSQVLFEEI